MEKSLVSLSPSNISAESEKFEDPVLSSTGIIRKDIGIVDSEEVSATVFRESQFENKIIEKSHVVAASLPSTSRNEEPIVLASVPENARIHNREITPKIFIGEQLEIKDAKDASGAPIVLNRSKPENESIEEIVIEASLPKQELDEPKIENVIVDSSIPNNKSPESKNMVVPTITGSAVIGEEIGNTNGKASATVFKESPFENKIIEESYVTSLANKSTYEKPIVDASDSENEKSENQVITPTKVLIEEQLEKKETKEVSELAPIELNQNKLENERIEEIATQTSLTKHVLDEPKNENAIDDSHNKKSPQNKEIDVLKLTSSVVLSTPKENSAEDTKVEAPVLTSTALIGKEIRNINSEQVSTTVLTESQCESKVMKESHVAVTLLTNKGRNEELIVLASVPEKEKIDCQVITSKVLIEEQVENKDAKEASGVTPIVINQNKRENEIIEEIVTQTTLSKQELNEPTSKNAIVDLPIKKFPENKKINVVTNTVLIGNYNDKEESATVFKEGKFEDKVMEESYGSVASLANKVTHEEPIVVPSIPENEKSENQVPTPKALISEQQENINTKEVSGIVRNQNKLENEVIRETVRKASLHKQELDNTKNENLIVDSSIHKEKSLGNKMIAVPKLTSTVVNKKKIENVTGKEESANVLKERQNENKDTNKVSGLDPIICKQNKLENEIIEGIVNEASLPKQELDEPKNESSLTDSSSTNQKSHKNDVSMLTSTEVTGNKTGNDNGKEESTTVFKESKLENEMIEVSYAVVASLPEKELDKQQNKESIVNSSTLKEILTKNEKIDVSSGHHLNTHNFVGSSTRSPPTEDCLRTSSNEKNNRTQLAVSISSSLEKSQRISPKCNLLRYFQSDITDSCKSSTLSDVSIPTKKTDLVCATDFDERLAEEAGNVSDYILSVSREIQDSDSESEHNKTVITTKEAEIRGMSHSANSKKCPESTALHDIRGVQNVHAQDQYSDMNSVSIDEYMQSMRSVLPAHLNQSEAGPITADQLSTQDLEFQDGANLDLDFFTQREDTEAVINNPLTRQSLYVKFDPLVNAIVSRTDHNLKMPPPPTSLPDREEHIDPVPSDSESAGQGDCERTPGRSPALEAVQKLISVTPPSAPSAAASPVKSIYDNVYWSWYPYLDRSTVSTTTSATPKSASISQKDLKKLEDLMKDREAYFESELGKKQAELEKREKEMTIMSARLAELNAEAKAAAEREQRLKKEVHERTKSKQQLSLVMEEYEKTISQLVAQKEEEKKEFEVQKVMLMKERDTAMQHLNNMEIAFNDIHQKYERSKTVIEGMKSNEEVLKKSLAEYDEAVKSSNARYDALKSHAIRQLETANQELDHIRRSHETEIAKLNAMLKKAEVHATTLEETLERKSKENHELASICDELINKVGGANN